MIAIPVSIFKEVRRVQREYYDRYGVMVQLHVDQDGFRLTVTKRDNKKVHIVQKIIHDEELAFTFTHKICTEYVDKMMDTFIKEADDKLGS